MSGTHCSLHYHLIFSTKNRYPFIKESWEPRLHSYLGGILANLNAVSESIGGTQDHVHIAASLKATHRISDILRDLKAGSSGWIHQELGYRFFDWQNGYGAFTVSRSDLNGVKQYIRGQKDHHRHKSFQEEYRELLLRNGIEFDERYLW
jgi:putative transposase